jgi:chromosome segregation ATPase
LQNKELNQSINVLNTQLKHMDDEINTLSQTNSGLEQDKARLRTGVDDLQQHLKQAAIELQKAEATLQSARNEHDSILLQLREKVTQLDQSEKQLSFEVKKASTVQLSLDETIDILSKSVITDGQQRAEFMEKLRELITNKDAFFTNAAKRILDAENELTRVTKELEQTNQHYKALISEYETQIAELKTIVTKDKQDPMVDIRPPIGRNSLFYLRPTINSGLPSSDCYTAPL